MPRSVPWIHPSFSPSCFASSALPETKKSSDDSVKLPDPERSCSVLPCFQNLVACSYRAALSHKKQLIITVTWCKSDKGQVLSVNVDDDPSCICKVDTNSWQFWKKKGSKTIQVRSTEVDVHWDISSAKFGAGPEPLSQFHLLVMVGMQIVLLLGDIGEANAEKKYNATGPIALFSLIERREYLSGRDQYSTKVRFIGDGAIHSISIKCRAEEAKGRPPELTISIDQKKVVHVKRLQWKFRGNQTVFLDGLPLDVMWDVHGWLFRTPTTADAVFVFRIRGGSESRLWFEEKIEEEANGFSLLLYACRS